MPIHISETQIPLKMAQLKKSELTVLSQTSDVISKYYENNGNHLSKLFAGHANFKGVVVDIHAWNMKVKTSTFTQVCVLYGTIKQYQGFNLTPVVADNLWTRSVFEPSEALRFKSIIYYRRFIINIYFSMIIIFFKKISTVL
jgi:hypothetical protein